jgi:hypothetical protein
MNIPKKMWKTDHKCCSESLTCGCNQPMITPIEGLSAAFSPGQKRRQTSSPRSQYKLLDSAKKPQLDSKKLFLLFVETRQPSGNDRQLSRTRHSTIWFDGLAVVSLFIPRFNVDPFDISGKQPRIPEYATTTQSFHNHEGFGGHHALPALS